MDSILEIHDAIKISQNKANNIIEDSLRVYSESDDEEEFSNALFHMDNLDAIKNLITRGYSGKLDLVYLDPPFFTNLVFNKNISLSTPEGDLKFKVPLYSDDWDKKLFDYFEMMATRLFLIKELLSDIGTIYVHIDWRVVHYIRIIMDCVFGRDRFLNEIIWAYKSGGAGRRSFSKKHDNILVYTKSKNYIFNVSKEKSYNRDLKPYRFKNIEEYKDEKGWFTLVNSKDVWNIDMVGRTSSERVDYATQKPFKLLEKIILTSSNKQSLVGDFFVGSGTTLVVADKLDRRWVGSDSSIHSLVQVKKRLQTLACKYKNFSKKEDNVSSLKNLKAIIIENFLKLDLSDIEIDIEGYLGLNQATVDKDKIMYLKGKSYLLLDYISIYYRLKPSMIIAEIFRPEINSKFKIQISNPNIEEMCVKSVDIWGNSYTNNFSKSLSEI